MIEGLALVDVSNEYEEAMNNRSLLGLIAACLPLAQVPLHAGSAAIAAGERDWPPAVLLECLKSAFGGGAKMPFVFLIFQKHRVGLCSRYPTSKR
jgi:hypothetical protein